eukprot:s1874_g21.t1
MFIPFAPLDRRAKELIKKKNTIPSINCAIFLTADKLLKYGARLSPDGRIVIGQIVPFSDFDAVWYYDDAAKCPRRLLTAIGETQCIASIAKCKRVADIGKLHAVKRKVISDASEDREIVERIKELDSKIEKKILSLQRGSEVWNELVSLFTLVFTPTQSGFTLCPGCLSETPSIFALCVHCEGILLSHGCRQSLVQEDEHDEKETTIPDEPVIDIHDHVKEAMKTMKEEEDSDTEMKEELPEETLQIVREEEDKIFNEGDDDEETEEVETDASGMRRKMQYEQEEQDAINANIGVTSDTIDVDDDAGPSAPTTVTEPDVSDPVLTLRVEQFSVVEDVQIKLSQRVRQWDFKTRDLTEEAARCLDASRRASMIMDLQVGCAIRDIIHLFYLRYVGGHPDSVERFFRQKTNRRPDVDGDYPFYGVDEDGNYAEPPDEETLIDWADKNWKRYPKEFVWTAYRGGLFFKKLLQYSLACGLKREDFQAEFGNVQTDKVVLTSGDERGKLQARSKALQDLERQSEFVRRLYRGAFECKAYSYFRQDGKGMQDILFAPPDENLLAARENSRKVSAVYMVDFDGYTLPQKVLHAYYKEVEKVKASGNYFPLWGIHLHQDHIKALTEAAPSYQVRTHF